MINYFSNYNYPNTLINPNKRIVAQSKSNSTYGIGFQGISSPSHYRTSFDYLASEIVSRNKKWGVDGSMLSAANIRHAIDKLFKLNKVFGPYIEANKYKIPWRNYIAPDVREYCVNKVNDARAERLKEWQDLLEDPQKVIIDKKHMALAKEIQADSALRFIIWNAINSELKPNNRHIPVPLDLTALEETISYFQGIQPKFRAVTCASASFLKMYTHRLRDNLLMQKELSDPHKVWIKIPSAKHDRNNLSSNITTLEILSYKNWCTRSSVDKAADALADGDFYIFLRRDEQQIWHPTLGMTSSKGKIDQIQGRENNNFIPLNELENIKHFIYQQGLKLQSGMSDEGPKALQQMLIAEKLIEYYPIANKTLDKAIKDKDSLSIYKIMGEKIKLTPDNKYELETYKPQFVLNKKNGVSVPYSFLGIDENSLLENVEIISGNLILADIKNPMINSTITVFPPNLKKVTGKIICTRQQYEMFQESIMKVVSSPENIHII